MADDSDVVRAFEIHERVQQSIVEKSLFTTPLNLLPDIERLHRAHAPGIIPNPNHMCINSNCAMLELKVRIYRWRVDTSAPMADTPLSKTREIVPLRAKGGLGAPPNPPSMMRADTEYEGGGIGGGQPPLIGGAPPPLEVARAMLEHHAHEYVHVCLEDSCEEKRMWDSGRRHPSNPHARAYSTQDQFEFRDLWACSITGNVHACGNLCTQRYTTIGGEGLHVCPLTRMVLGTQLERDIFGSNTQPTAALGSGDTDLMPTRGAVYRRDVASHIQLEQIAAHCLASVEAVVVELLTSPRRARSEFDIAMRGEQKRHDAILQVVRKKNPHSNFKSPIYARAVWKAMQLRSNSEYFKTFSPPTTIQPYIAGALHTFAIKTGRRAALHPDSQARIRRNTARIHALMNGGLRGAGAPPNPPSGFTHEIGGGLGGAPPPLIAKIVLFVYKNLERYIRAMDPDKPFPSFRSLFLYILYFMRIGYRVPATFRRAANLEDSCNVVVIPRIYVLELLPPENTLGSYSSVTQLCSFSRSVVTIQKEIMAMYLRILRAGGIFDVAVDVDALARSASQ